MEGMKVWGRRGPVLGGLVGCQDHLGGGRSVEDVKQQDSQGGLQGRGQWRGKMEKMGMGREDRDETQALQHSHLRSHPSGCQSAGR